MTTLDHRKRVLAHLEKQMKPTSLEKRIANIRRKQMDLSGDMENSFECDPHRPPISIMADGAGTAESPACVSLCISALWGQHSRYVDLLPAEARTLAKLLTDMADAIECEEPRS